MKEIAAITTHLVRVPPNTSPNLKDINRLIADARRNRLHVIEGALTVEGELEDIIREYFFPGSPEKSDSFEVLILHSSWCTFRNKRSLVRHIIHELDLFKGKAKSDFDDLMKDVESFRNAFTHGTLVSDGTSVSLHYFEGTPQEKLLTDVFLTEVETTLREAERVAVIILEKIGARHERS